MIRGTSGDAGLAGAGGEGRGGEGSHGRSRLPSQPQPGQLQLPLGAMWGPEE